LEYEALQLWRKKRDEILTEPEDGKQRKVWDPVADVIKLFKEHLGVPSAKKVRELQILRNGEKETCRMLKSRVERLAEETGLLNGREQAMPFVKALPSELRQRGGCRVRCASARVTALQLSFVTHLKKVITYT
jgi:hypothetical protein